MWVWRWAMREGGDTRLNVLGEFPRGRDVAGAPKRAVLADPSTDGHHLGYALALADALYARGFQMTLLTWKLDAGTEELRRTRPWLRTVTVGEGGGSVPRVAPMRTFVRSYRCWRAAAREAASSGDCVIHWLYADRQELALFVASRRNDPPAVATLFWPYFVHGAGAPSGRVKSRYHALNKGALESLIRRGKLASLAVHTERIKGLLLSALELEPDRVVVVPDPAIPMSLPTRAEARAALNVAEGEKLVLFFGGMRPDKGPDLLVDALQRMIDVPGWKAYLAGASGVFTAEGIATRLRVSGLEDRIQAEIGYVSDARMAQCFAAADVVVLPYRSTFLGTSGVLQASAVAGRPVLVTDVGDVGAAVREFGLGLVVQPDSVDELERGLRSILANMETLRVECASGSLRYSAEHSPSRLVEGLIPAYVSAVARVRDTSRR